MMQYEVAKKYGQALFSLAAEEKNVVSFYEKLAEFWDVINKNEELKDILFHPRVKPEDKKKILQKVFGKELPQTIYNFLFLLIDKRREYFFASILKRYKEMLNEKENIMEIKVISAIPLQEEYRNKLKGKLNDILDYKIILKAEQDPEIIGGLILKAGDYIIDGSIKNKLNSLTEKIKSIPVSKLGV